MHSSERQPYEVRETLVSICEVGLELEGRKILDGVSAEVKNIVRPGCSQGQVVGILGPSGVGKTQLSLILAGLQKPTSGYVRVGNGNGKNVEAGLVGFVAQNYPLLKHRTVLGNLILASRRMSNSNTEAKDRALEYLRRFELEDKANEYPARLSGGQRQRVSIAAQLLCSDHYIIMDEPFTGLDPLMKDRTVDLINQVALMHEENTIFVVAHDISAVMSVADTIWLLGRNRNPDGSVGGSKIQCQWDLAAMGLAWQPGIASTQIGQAFLNEVKEAYRRM